MRRPAARLYVGFFQAAFLLVGGTALADGGAFTSAGMPGNDTIVAQVTYRCMGGVRVQVNQMADNARVRVDFAGRSRILHLMQDASGMHYQNPDFDWFTKGNMSFMKNRHSGQLTLRGCVQTQ